MTGTRFPLCQSRDYVMTASALALQLVQGHGINCFVEFDIS
jgi:hypothetical protein